MLVTPLAGVWIEISCGASSGRGCLVTPLAGVWIEIPLPAPSPVVVRGHTPRGCVD